MAALQICEVGGAKAPKHGHFFERNEPPRALKRRRTTGGQKTICPCMHVQLCTGGSGRRSPDCLPACQQQQLLCLCINWRLDRLEPKQQRPPPPYPAASTSRPSKAAHTQAKWQSVCAACESVMLWGARRRPVAMMEAGRQSSAAGHVRGVEGEKAPGGEIHSQRDEDLVPWS